MSKVSIIGAGYVGSTVAHWAMISGGCQIVLLDVVDGLAKGKVLDLIQSGPIAGHAIDAIGTTDYADTADSDIVIITAGVARKPGMTREDLVHINAGIVTDVVRQVVERQARAEVDAAGPGRCRRQRGDDAHADARAPAGALVPSHCHVLSSARSRCLCRGLCRGPSSMQRNIGAAWTTCRACAFGPADFLVNPSRLVVFFVLSATARRSVITARPARRSTLSG